MDSNTRPMMALTARAVESNFSVLLMAVSPGKVRLLFLTGRRVERSTWILMATSLLVVKARAAFGVFAQATHRMGVRRQHLTRAPPLAWVASLVSGESIQTDSMEWSGSRSIIPAARLTITFTCWPASCRVAGAQRT